MRHDGVSEILGAIFLIAVAVLAMGIIVVILLSGPLPTRIPAFSGLITNSSSTVFITHEGGDPLYPGTFQVLVDGKDETSNFTKSFTGPFTLGKVMNATLPSMPRRVVLVFNTSWGGGTILASADLGETIPYTPPGWYSGAWQVRKKITINHNQVQGSLIDFPVLLSFADNGLKNNASSTGNDILFTASDGVTKLPHEIEGYTSNNGALVSWVKVPSLSSSADTVIFMYYKNPGAPSQQNAVNVWTNGYAGVWHLGETSGTTRHDSTANNNDLVESGGPIANSTSGKIGGAANFVRASTQYLWITDAAQTGLDITGPITLEAWALADENTTPPYQIFDKSRGTTCGSGDPPYFLRLNDPVAGAFCECFVVSGVCGTNPTDAQPGGVTISTGAWYFLAGTYDGSFSRVYRNGVQTDSVSSSSGIFNSNGGFYIGSQVNAQYFDGLIDEARVSNVNRSVQWLATEYNNQNSPASFSTIESTEQDRFTMRW
ncbi:MAG TPA: DUF2341 domain-containing protein [Methanomicrobiales archaeon]|nr:DUF2341 domain-containing protein [Methanomicrobiales archaeon]